MPYSPPDANRPKVTTPRQQPTEAEATAIANIALLGQQSTTTTAGLKWTIAAAKTDRAHRGRAKIKARLIGSLDPDDWDLPPKPKWIELSF
jgi:hypothetical protein